MGILGLKTTEFWVKNISPQHRLDLTLFGCHRHVSVPFLATLWILRVWQFPRGIRELCASEGSVGIRLLAHHIRSWDEMGFSGRG